MWVEQLEVRGFRRLRGTFVFDKGLTLVIGDNEAGKSSLHEALIRALFGFPRGDRMRRGGISVKDNCSPWLEPDFGINALVREVKGKSLRVEWDFETHRVTLLDATTGEDLSQCIRLKREEVRLGQYLLGLTLDDFREVCCLDQAAVDAVERTENLVLALQQSIESTARDHGVDSAVVILNDRLREAGVHVISLTPSPAGALINLIRERDTLTQQIENADTARREIAQRAVDLAAVQGQLASLRGEVSRIDLKLLRTEADRLQRLLEKALQLQADSQAVTEPLPVIPQSVVDRIAELTAALRATRGSVAQLEEQAARATGAREELERQLSDSARSLQSVPDHADMDPTLEGDVRRLLGQREHVVSDRTALEIPETPVPDPGIERYRSNRPRLIELQRLAERSQWRTGRLAVAGVIAVACLVLGVTVNPIYFTGLAVALLVALTARTGAAGARDLSAALSEFGAGSIEELEERVRHEEHRVATAAALIAERQRLASTLDKSLAAVDVELTRILDRARVPEGNVITRAERYVEICRTRLERAQLQLRYDTLAADLQANRRPLNELTSKRGDEADLVQQLQALYTEIGIDAADLTRAADEVRNRLERATAIEQRRTRAESAASALRTLLGTQTIGALETHSQQVREKLNAEAGALDRHDHTDVDREALEASKDELLSKIQLRQRKEAELQTLMGAQESALPDIAVLKERRDWLLERIGRTERASAAVRIAREALEEAARETHRRFAPYLNAALQRHLPRITDGRYLNAVVDEDLQIRVQAPETAKFVPVEVLSRGTQDQIYFIQRLEIVRLLDPTTGEAPLLLDDAFTRFDAKRLQLAFGILSEVATERQVVLFTEDEGMVRRAEQSGAACSVIRLPAPTARAQSTPAAIL
jgi:DNA repair exonuclease SbcCD ATPase subunit